MGAGAFKSQLSHWILNLDRSGWLMVIFGVCIE